MPDQNDQDEQNSSQESGAPSQDLSSISSTKGKERENTDPVGNVSGKSGHAHDQLLSMQDALNSEATRNGADRTPSSNKNLDMAELLKGLSVKGKNKKEMSSYKFWQTQPVPRFDDASKEEDEDGPIKIIDPAQVPKEPKPMIEGFEWVTMNLEDEKEIEEVYELLYGHYVEDDEAMFRFNYSQSFLNWALKSPRWSKQWHVGVRASKSRKLVAFISGVPIQLRVRSNVVNSIEINFLCVHKKLRSKRLTPVLIQEITRRCYIESIFQAIYTAGIVLPKPFTTCRYFHRSLDWLKLYEVNFSPLPANSTKARQITRYNLPSSTETPGLRPMEQKDIPAVGDLLKRYLERFQVAPVFDHGELEHWLLHDPKAAEQVIWSFVVENVESKKVTDFFSFYCLESSVIGNRKHDNVRAAYLFYYATEAAFAKEETGLKERLNALMHDALILARRSNFDVFNALTLLDNPLFLEQQKFGAGDGQLHYYLYNYRTGPIAGGVDEKNNVDPSKRGGIGVVML